MLIRTALGSSIVSIVSALHVSLPRCFPSLYFLLLIQPNRLRSTKCFVLVRLSCFLPSLYSLSFLCPNIIFFLFSTIVIPLRSLSVSDHISNPKQKRNASNYFPFAARERESVDDVMNRLRLIRIVLFTFLFIELKSEGKLFVNIVATLVLP